jgi:DedD protein
LNDILKQRLVGALVIIALAVVFWPFIFVESSREIMDRSSQVPRMPQLKDQLVAEPTPLTGLDPVETVQELVLHDAPPGAVDTIEVEETVTVETDSGSLVESQIEPTALPSRTDIPSQAPAPALDERGIPVAWMLQVVSVSDKDKANRLVQELVDLGYKSYVKPVTRGERRLYRVHVGPMFERSKIEELKPVIDKKMKVSSIVARYVP